MSGPCLRPRPPQELELPKKLRGAGAWLWAAATVASRTVYVPFDAAGALCPFGDLFNYAPPPAPSDPETDGGSLLPELDHDDLCPSTRNWQPSRELQASVRRLETREVVLSPPRTSSMSVFARRS